MCSGDDEVAIEIPAPQPGQTFVLSEQDYRYGLGPVVARILKLIEVVTYDNEPWWQVEADVAQGTPRNHGGWVQRQLYIRQSRPSTDS